jgi:transcriptional regulator GlxA family with amidase domain
MLTRAGRGLHFSECAAAVRDRFESLFLCTPAERLLNFLAILHQLANERGEQLASHSPALIAPQESRERIDRILTHIHAGYAQPIRLEELAEIAALSQSALQRLFLKHTSKTISDYLGHLRIGDACARLSGTSQPINVIAEAVRYPSLANFNRQFRTPKGMTPREYRKLFAGREQVPR